MDRLILIAVLAFGAGAVRADVPDAKICFLEGYHTTSLMTGPSNPTRYGTGERDTTKGYLFWKGHLYYTWAPFAPDVFDSKTTTDYGPITEHDDWAFAARGKLFQFRDPRWETGLLLMSSPEWMQIQGVDCLDWAPT